MDPLDLGPKTRRRTKRSRRRRRRGGGGKRRGNRTQKETMLLLRPLVFFICVSIKRRVVQIRKTQDEPQWIVAQGLLSALTIPGFS